MDIIDRAWVFRSDLGFLLENIHFKLAESFESFIVKRVILFARSRKLQILFAKLMFWGRFCSDLFWKKGRRVCSDQF